jgi:hypothetical protein
MANHGAFKETLPDRDFAGETKENEKKLRARKGAVQRVEDVAWGLKIEDGDLLSAEELQELGENQAF